MGFESPIFHLGFHKTATTLIQRMLRAQAAAGRCVALTPASEELRGVRAGMMRSRDHEHRPADEAIRALKQLLEQFPGDTRPVCMSDENLLCFPPYRHPEPASMIRLYPSLERQLGVLATLAVDHEFTLVLVIRRQADFIQSLYFDGLKYFRYGLTADEYVHSLDLSSMNWRDRLSRIPDILRQRTTLLAYERLASHPHEFLGTFCPLDAESARGLVGEVVNSARPRGTLAIARLIGASGDEAKPALVKWFRAMPGLPATDVATPDLELSPALRNEIEQYFADDLAARWPFERAALSLSDALAL